MRYVVDTNVLLDKPEIILDYDVVILSHVNRELEKFKSGIGELSYKARRAVRVLRENKDKVFINFKDYHFNLNNVFDPSYVDNKIIQACYESGYGLITGDFLLQHKAKGFNIEVVESNNFGDDFDDLYQGVRDLYIDTNIEEHQQQLAKIYEDASDNFLDLKTNEYLLLWDLNKPSYKDGKIVGYQLIDRLKWDGSKLTKLKFKTIGNEYTGKIKPINHKQECAFDLLQNQDITLKAIFGGYGVGKDFLMISHAVNLIQNGKFEKLIWVRNNVEVKDTNPIGFLPSDMTSKLLPYAMPLADHVGGMFGLEMMIKEGKIEIQHLGFMRGRDIKNSIIYVTEIQNNTDEHVKLLVGRVGDGSQLWVNGDVNQSDEDKFKIKSSIKTLTKLKGQHLYGQVVLDKIERSKTARLAELLN